MSVDTAAADRLPWLADDPLPPKVKKPRRGGSVAVLLTAVVAVAGVGFWMGERSVHETSRVSAAAASTTVLLPPPSARVPQVPAAPQAELRTTSAPKVNDEVLADERVPAPPAHHSPARKAPKTQAQPKQEQPSPALQPTIAIAQASPPRPQFAAPAPWNPRVFAGASGRLVQVGSFGSVHQAKRGWWAMVRAYPAMAHLPSVVRESRNSRGKEFYRFQVGTTSQAHSEVLCQRMEKIDLSCAVLGLPWKAKVER